MHYCSMLPTDWLEVGCLLRREREFPYDWIYSGGGGVP